MKGKSKKAKRIFGTVLSLAVVAGTFSFACSTKVQAEEVTMPTMLGTQDYILANLDTTLANPEKLEAVDLIEVTHILTDRSKLPEVPEGKTLLNSIYDAEEYAFIVAEETVLAMYNTDDNSDYYVAYVDTMHNNVSSEALEASFAYTNIEGDVISNAIFDKATGIAYIPKNYENKNELGYMNVQVQLVQACDASNLTTTFKTIVNNEDGIEGDFISNGYIDYRAIDTEVMFKVANDDVARANLTANDLLIAVNGYELDEYTYDSRTGEVYISTNPVDIETLTITIKKDCNENGIDAADFDEGISAYANGSALQAADTRVKVSGTPTPGSYYITGITTEYFAGAGNRHASSNHPNVNTGVTNASMRTLWNTINQGWGDPGNLTGVNYYMSWQVRLPDLTININGCDIQIPSSTWDLKCVENSTSAINGYKYQSSSGHYLGDKMTFTIFEVNNNENWMLVGMSTPQCTTQAGAAVFKIYYEGSTGSLEVGKRDNFGQLVGGAVLHVTGPNYDQWVTTQAGATTRLDNCPKGDYAVVETQAPNNMVRNGNTYWTTVNSGQTSWAIVDNSYQRGATTLTKYDGDRRGATLGDATIEGARYNLYAATEIWEGPNRIYWQDQLIAENIYTKADGTTDAVGNLPIGSYYYVEQSPSRGFNLNSNRVGVSVTYSGQDNWSANTGYCETAEAPIYGNIKIYKKLDLSDNDSQILLAGAQFRATLKSNPSQYYDSNVSGADGVCSINNIPYGDYVVEEIVVPNSAYKVDNYDVFIENNGQTYERTIVDGSKKMNIQIDKSMLLNDGEATDAVLKGAVFTVYRDAACTDEVCKIGPTDSNGYAISNTMWTGRYYLKETTFPVGVHPDRIMPDGTTTYKDKVYSVYYDNATQGDSEVTVVLQCQNAPIRGTIEVDKFLQESDYDATINLEGAQFRATLNSDPTSYFDSNVTGVNGIATINNIPYGTYTVEEIVVPDSALKIDNFQVFVDEEGKVYKYDKTDVSKKMTIQVNKHIVVNEGEATDAVLEGAVFTVYRDAQAKIPYVDKTGKVVRIGPTDANGYAESKTMWTGEYYIKETTFPTGIDPDAIVTGENVTYRNKVYNVSIPNTTQTVEMNKFTQDVDNKPNRNDLEGIKMVCKTSNTPQFPIDQCEFTATLKSTIGTDHVFSRKCTAQTDRFTGYFIIEDLPYGEYVVEETTVSPISLKCANFDVFIEKDRKVQTFAYEPKDATQWYGDNPLDDANNVVDIAKVVYLKMRKVDTDRTDVNPVDYVQGDAVLKGAIYQIFRYDPMTDAYTEPVYEITVDHQDSEGYWCAESQDLLVGNYMMKEKVKYTEEVNGKEVKYSFAEGYLVDEKEYYFIQNPVEQEGRATYHTNVSDEQVIRGEVHIIKYDDILGSTEDVASKGAKLRLTLDSNPDIWYDTTIRADGSAEFVDTTDADHKTAVSTHYGMKYAPRTIPYGKYTITEIAESEASAKTHFYIQPESVDIRDEAEIEYRIEADVPVEMYIRVQKRDKDTNATVHVPGAKYKIWDVAKSQFVTQKVYPSGKYIDEYETNEKGYLNTPELLEAGDYIVYETKAPEGYYLEDTLRLPENPEDIGVKGKGGTYVVIDKDALKIKVDTIANKTELTYVDDESDTPLKGRLEIFKKGEKLTDSKTSASKYGDVYTPVYEEVGLEGVTYKIYAAQDIKSPDGRVTYVTKGMLVDTITTNAEGLAATKDLYLGEYRIEEVEAPAGYIIDKEIDNVVLTNTNELVKVEPHRITLGDDRQKLQVTFNKMFEENIYSSTPSNDKTATFAVKAAENIKNYKGQTVIAKDSIVCLVDYKNGQMNGADMDLPEATYNIEEVDCSAPYSICDTVLSVKTVPTTSQQAVEVYYAGELNNTFESTTLSLMKLSSKVMDHITLNGSKLDESTLEESLKDVIEEIKLMDANEIKEYAKEHNTLLEGATYSIYLDEACTKPLYVEENGKMVEVKLQSDENGQMIAANIPLGTYYVKEDVAPRGYEINPDVIKVVLKDTDKDTILFLPLADNPTVGPFIKKTDIFTGEVIPNCTFEIRDADEEVIMRAITDENGIAYIPMAIFDNGETYYYCEIDAPEIYDLNLEPHEFVAEYEVQEDAEGNAVYVWTADLIKVSNIRKTGTVKLIKTDAMDSKLIPNCKFVLQSLENKDWKVEGVTDENGIYEFENVPYGTYTYTELEAPEEYNIDTTPHEFTVSRELTILEVTNELNTGDIAVAALAIVAVICVAGIVFVVVRKKSRK